MKQQVAEMMLEKNYAIMDVEYIRTSRTHRCVRKLYMLAKNGFDDLELEFYSCVRYKDLKNKYQRSFQYCKNNIHKLQYDPIRYSPECTTAASKVNTFIVYNNIDFILYKGGTIEKELCDQLCISSYNIDSFTDLEKAYSHDPRTEVNIYYGQLVELL